MIIATRTLLLSTWSATSEPGIGFSRRCYAGRPAKNIAL
jgi:hypothetical protein